MLQRKLLIPLKENNFSVEVDVSKQVRGRVPLGVGSGQAVSSMRTSSLVTNIVSGFATGVCMCVCVSVCVFACGSSVRVCRNPFHGREIEA